MFNKNHDHRNEISADDSLDARLEQMGQKIRAPYKLRNAAKTGVPLHGEDERRIAPVRPRLGLPKIAALAMSALLAVGGGFGIAVEAQAYNEAIDFFEEYNMSAEGFSRSEVKKIYKDIISKSFTYEKTEEALASGLEGYEIQAQPLDSEGLKRVWMTGYEFGVDLKDYAATNQSNVEYSYVLWENTGNNTGGSEIVLRENQKTSYVKTLNNIDINAIRTVGDQIVAAGDAVRFGNTYSVQVYLLNSDMTVVWNKTYPASFQHPRVDYIHIEKDTLTLFVINRIAAETRYNMMWIATLDMDGNLIKEELVDYDAVGGGIHKVVSIGEDYLIVKKDAQMRDVLFHKKGDAVQENVVFGNGDQDYLITDMVEFNGLVYLSGRMVPKTESGVWGQYDEYVEQFGEKGATDEELYQFYLENHTAVLLICDPKTGEPQSFYTIPGASGGKLSVSGNKLTWNVNRYTGASGYTIATGDLFSVYLASGNCLGTITANKWQYVFTPYGQIVGEKDTGKSVQFEG